MQPNMPTLSLAGVVETETTIDSDNEELLKQKDNSENERKQKRHAVGK